jgi:hypothetical protein
MNSFVAALSLFLLLLSGTSALLILSRIRPGVSPASYVPLLIELPVALLLLGVALLPQGFPSLFGRILGHSITVDYIYPPGIDGTIVTETWISAQWWTPIGDCFSIIAVIGIAWSIWNLRKKAERPANILAFALGIFWFALSFVNTLNSILYR